MQFFIHKFISARTTVLDMGLRIMLLTLWLVLFGLLLFLSVTELDERVSLFPNVDKLYHLGYYSMLALLWAFATREKWIVMAGCLFMLHSGILIESLQYYLPARSFSFLDIIANITGLVLGSCLFLALRKKRLMDLLK